MSKARMANLAGYFMEGLPENPGTRKLDFFSSSTAYTAPDRAEQFNTKQSLLMDDCRQGPNQSTCQPHKGTMDLLEVHPPVASVELDTTQDEKADSGSLAFRSFLTAAMDDKYEGDHYMLENAPPQSEDFVRFIFLSELTTT